MRILVLATDVYGGHGGIALANRNLVQALTEMPEVDGVVVLPRAIPLLPQVIPNKVRFVSGAAGGKVKYVLNALLAALGQYDLVICGHINLLPLAVVLNTFIRAPLALMVHGIDVWQQPYRHARRWLSHVTAIWSVSAITKQRMNSWAELPDATYTILPNAIKLELYGMGEPRYDLVQRYNLQRAKVVMTLARLSGAEQYKGLDEILDVLPALRMLEPTLKYVIAGDGDDRPRLERKAIALGLAEHVVFTGMVTESEKADVLRLADVFAMPGRGEGFGFVFMEAMACGIPVVGSSIDGSREALRDGMLGVLVDPADPQDIQRGILEALGKRKAIPEGIEYFAWPAFSSRIAAAAMHLLPLKWHS